MAGLSSRAASLARKVEKSAKLKLPENTFEAIGFEPRDWQAEALAQDRRFNVRVVHRRAGKSVFEDAKLFDRAVENPLPDPRYAYCAPTFAQAKDIAWTYVTQMHENYCRKIGIDAERWRSLDELSVTLPTRAGSRARIRLYGLDSPKQRVRGLYLDGVVMDEWAWIPSTAWTEQIRAMLSDGNRRGVDLKGRPNQWADFIFTPYGRNHAYHMFRNAELWQDGKAVIDMNPVTQEETETRSEEWTAFLRRASETGVIAQDELDRIRADVGPAKFEQEFECSFDAAVVGAVYARDLEEARETGRVGNFPWIKHLPVHTAWDLGWTDATGIVFFQIVGERMRIMDYYEAQNAPLDHFVDVLGDKPYRYGRMFFPHDVEQEHLAAGGVSTKAQLRKMGVRVTTVSKHRIRDRIAATQGALSRCEFHEEPTRNLLDRLALYRRKENPRTGMLSANPEHDWTSHAADAFGYAIMGRRSAGLDRERGMEQAAYSEM